MARLIYRLLCLLGLGLLVLGLTPLFLHAQTTPPPATQPINLTATPAPVWFKASVESSQVRLMLPQGTVFRFGDTANNKWSVPTIVNGTAITTTPGGSGNQTAQPYQLIPYWSNMPFPDPDVGTLKELDILEQPWVQTINAVDAMGQNFTITVPALPLPPPPPINPLGLPLGLCYVNQASNGNFVMTCTPLAP